MSAIPVIIPVKALADAKQRLSPVLSAGDRHSLVLAMLSDVLATLSKSKSVGNILVVTPDRDVAALARAKGAGVLAETYPGGLNAAVHRGLSHSDVQRADKALILPADVPLATTAEITVLLEAASRRDGPRVTLAPSRDGGGTNALLLSPPDVIAPQFGPDSFVKHLAAAVARRIDAEVIQLPGLARDIDLPDDLSVLRQQRMGAEPYAFLWPGSETDSASMRTMP